MNHRPRPYQLSPGFLRRSRTNCYKLRFAGVYAAPAGIGLCYSLRPLAATVDLGVHQFVNQLPRTEAGHRSRHKGGCRTSTLISSHGNLSDFRLRRPLLRNASATRLPLRWAIPANATPPPDLPSCSMSYRRSQKPLAGPAKKKWFGQPKASGRSKVIKSGAVCSSVSGQHRPSHPDFLHRGADPMSTPQYTFFVKAFF